MSEVDHRSIIAALSDDERRVLTGKANLPGLFRLAFHLGTIAFLSMLILLKVALWPLLMLPLGVMIVFLFTALHETIHETAFKNGWINRAVGLFAGFAILLPPLWFRYFHLAHHRHTHDPDNDPELMGPKPETLWQYLKYLSGIPYWTGMLRVIVVNALGRNEDAFVSPRARDRVAAESRQFILAYSILIAVASISGSMAVLWLWILPALIGQPLLRAYLLAEHTRCPHVANMLENTRTTFTTRLVRLIAWNMPYHSEHHSYPAVPFHKLPRFHTIVAEHLRTTENGYLRFHRRLVRDMADPSR
jgi:fatty acid desaturase